MAIATSFDESNHVLEKPEDMTDEECSPLCVWSGPVVGPTGDVHPTVISCYKFTPEELAEFRRTGRIWVGVLGVSMPPIWVSGQNPFGEKR